MYGFKTLIESWGVIFLLIPHIEDFLDFLCRSQLFLRPEAADVADFFQVAF